MSEKKPKRVSMRGMGADAFFAPPAEQETAEVQSDTSVEVQSDTSVVVQETDSQRHEDIPVQSRTGVEVQKEQGSIVLKRDTSVIRDEQGDVKYIKVSYYIAPDQDLKLEEIRLNRRKRGVKVDKSELIREAIDKLTE